MSSVSAGRSSSQAARSGPAPLALAVLTLATLVPLEAAARTDLVLPYSVGEVWPSAVRFLRIDRGYVVKEKDEPSGYVLFELEEGKRTYRGAIELVRRRDDDGREATRIGISLPDLPRHFEQALLDKLAQKVRDDHGPPLPRRPAPKGSPDGGAPRR